MAPDGSTRTPRSDTVLVLSDDPMGAALLGVLTEMADCVPAFPNPGERPEDALARVRPVFVVLLDASLEAARSDLFFARAAKRHIRIAIFGVPGREVPDFEARARERGIPSFALPIDLPRFTEVLAKAGACNWWLGGGERRRPSPQPQLARGSDGTLIYTDRAGRRWYVYDRRGSDRRVADRRAPSAGDEPTDGPPQRLFVNERGEAWRYPLAAHEADESANLSPDDLERQLARAEKV